jgi:glycosyltransferase involved in cell wall biosynthesis|tara:strand:+ start:3605 stop:4729 length:1125 start_codon:yes stop_codon:yes gene_type:complete
MKLLINTASTFKGGGVQVAKSFIEECKELNEHEYFVVLGENISKSINKDSFPENFTFYETPFRPATKVFSWSSHNFFLKIIEKECKPDVVFTTTGPSYWRPKVKHVIGYNLPHYIYSDSPYFQIIPLKRKLWWKSMKIYAKYILKRDADSLVVQTDDVKERVKKLLSKKSVFTVSNTISKHYLSPRKAAKKLPVKAKNQFRLLTLSAWYPHKNLSIIPKVLDVLIKKGFTNIVFVVTLPNEDMAKLCFVDKYEGQLINTGQVKVEEGASLYQECDAMFLPTLLECFSASYAEAMQLNKPIITSDMGFAHTVCKDAALYVNSMDADDIASKIIELSTSYELQQDLVSKGVKRLEVFGSSHDRAKRYLEICEALIK